MKTPTIISHRGRGDHSLPENTIEACEEALKQGAEALEVDVRFCGSGELVVFHDLYLKRLTGKSGRIWATTLGELRRRPLAQSPQGSPLYIPTLAEFIDHFKGTVPINLDAKVFTPLAGQFAKYLVRAIKASGYREQFWVSSFNPIFLRTVKVCGMDIKTGYLFQHFNKLRHWTESLWYTEYWHPHVDMVDDKFLQLAEKEDKPLYVWTVNDETNVRRLLKEPMVAGIISDVPQHVHTIINGHS